MLGLTTEQETVLQASRSLGAALSIMKFAQRPEGATAEELLDVLQDVRAGTFYPRLYELLHAQCVHVAGRRETRSGCKARVYKTTEGATFLQYLECRGIAFNKRSARADLSDVERAVLSAGMKLLKAWPSARRREKALVTFIKRMDRILKLVCITTQKTQKEESDDNEEEEGDGNEEEEEGDGNEEEENDGNEEEEETR